MHSCVLRKGFESGSVEAYGDCSNGKLQIHSVGYGRACLDESRVSP